MYRKMNKYLQYLKKEHDVDVAELVTSDVIDRTESLNLLFDERNRTKMAFGPVLYSK